MPIRPRSSRGLVLFACLLLFWAAGAARAQPSSAAPSAAPAAVSAADLQHLVGTLQNESDRKKLIAELQALIAAQRGLAPKEAEKPPATILEGLSQQLDTISGEILAAAGVVVDAPWLLFWLKQQVNSQAARDLWLDVGLKLAIIFGLAFLAEWLVRRLLRRPAARLAACSGGNLALQLLLLAASAAVEALPILVFAGVAYIVVPLTAPRFATRQVATVLIGANLWARGLLAVARVALLSRSAEALYPLSGETRNYLYIWARRFTNWSVYGFAVAAGAWWLGVPGAIYALLLRGTALVLGILAVIFILQNRGLVGEWLRGHGGEQAGAGEGSPSESRGWRVLRHRLADIWHVLAIIYIVGTFGSYALRLQTGFGFVLRATALSVVVLLAAALMVRSVQRLSRRGFAIGPDLKARFPTLEARANRYLPMLMLVTSTVVYIFASLALLQAWGVDSFSWLETATGRKVAGSLFAIAIVMVAALILWELFISGIERYLSGLDGKGRPIARSARARTLLPLLRTTVLVVIVSIVAMIVLSELGFDIGPLLAGAGVVGIAIGFGSQALVKDVITGLFILVEDTLAIGDVVDVGNGHSGVVEAISIRTIRLRDAAGTVHTIPFSEVTTVQNLTKDFAYYVADVGVSYREDTDQVTAVLREVAEEMRQDPDFGPMMLEPLEVIGVDRFEESAVIIKVRMKTMPIRQWSVGREFNRRMKRAFDQHGIEMPFPHRTLYFGEDRRGQAPAARIRVEPADRPSLGPQPTTE
jgi:small conductance mechanosensitive channel